MLVFRKLALHEHELEGGFQIGDQICLGDHYTATCQKNGKNGAIFLFDQYLDQDQVMNETPQYTGGYLSSQLRTRLQDLVTLSIFNQVRELMVPFKKTGDLLRIPTVEEMFGEADCSQKNRNIDYRPLSNKKQWVLMKERRNRLAFRRDTEVNECGWLQNSVKDPKSLGYYASIVTSGGYLDEEMVFTKLGVRPVFRLKNIAEEV